MSTSPIAAAPENSAPAAEQPAPSAEQPAAVAEPPAPAAEPPAATPEQSAPAAEPPAPAAEPPAPAAEPPTPAAEPPAPAAEPPAPAAEPPAAAPEHSASAAEPPAAVAEPPAATPEQSAPAAEPPAPAAEPPAPAAEQPAAAPEHSASAAEPPAAVAEPPAAVAEPPAAVAEPPATAAEPPAAAPEHSASAAEQPAPAAEQPAPAAEQPAPAAKPPAPAATDADHQGEQNGATPAETPLKRTGEEPMTPAALTDVEGHAANDDHSPTTGGDDRVLSHVRKVYRSSETRTPIVLSLSDGDPYPSVVALARAQGSAVWRITMGSERNERNALDYIDVGTQMGDWVYLTNVENASQDVLRKIGLTLYTLKPDPRNAPRREFFRLVLVTEQPIKVNDLVRPILPQALMQNALVGCARVPTGLSPEKYRRRVPADVPLLQECMQKHERRRQVGRDSDSESDAEEPDKKATGLWFYRAVDFNTGNETTVARVNEIIFEAVEKQDVQAITDLCNSGRLKVDTVLRDGMTPIMYAVSREKVESTKALIAAGAKVDVRRESDGCPLLFMCIESEELAAELIKAGANIDELYQGYRLESHPSTMPHIAALIRELKGLPKQSTSAMQLAAALTAQH